VIVTNDTYFTSTQTHWLRSQSISLLFFANNTPYEANRGSTKNTPNQKCSHIDHIIGYSNQKLAVYFL
jgi:hypothetical protein